MNNQDGFTLLEVLVVVMIIGLIVPMTISLFVVNIQSYSRIKILQQVKENGDFVLDVIEQKIRNDVWAIYSNSSATDEVCSTKSSPYTSSTYSGNLYFRDSNQNIFYITNNNGVLEFTNGVTTNSLTNNQVNTDILTVSCSRSGVFSNPIIEFTFTLEQKYGSKYQDQARLTFVTKFKSR